MANRALMREAWSRRAIALVDGLCAFLPGVLQGWVGAVRQIPAVRQFVTVRFPLSCA
jgi:hypothetical protein